MMLRDPERSRSWPQYGYGSMSRKRLEIQSWLQWTTIGNGPLRSEWSRDWLRHVIRKCHSHDPNIFGANYLENRLEIRTWCKWSTYRKWLRGNQMVTWQMTSRDPERSCRGPNMLMSQYLENGWRYRLGFIDHHWDSNGHVTDDFTWPRKVKIMTPIYIYIYLGPIISTTEHL